MMKLMGIRLSWIWLVMTVAATAQFVPPALPVLDTNGQPLRRGLEYLINPALIEMFDSGSLTLLEHNISYAPCPKYVGEGRRSSIKRPVTFAPVEENDEVVRERKNFKATFSKPTKCQGSTTWKVGKRDPATQKRLIETGDGGRFGNYFLIEKVERLGAKNNIYNLVYCPTELCPTCKFECGNFEPLLTENREKLMSLGIDGFPLPVEFERVAIN